MFLILSFITIFSAVAVILAGSLGLIRDPQSRQNQWFFLASIFAGIWFIANFFGSSVVKQNLTVALVKIDFSLAIFMVWAFLQFAKSLYGVSGTKIRSKNFQVVNSPIFKIASVLVNVLTVIAIFSNHVIDISISTGNLKINYHSTFYVYLVAMFIYAIFALILLSITYRQAPTNRRQGLNLIWLGFFIAFSAGIASNIVFPLLFKDRTVVKNLNVIGYLGLMTLIGLVYVAITSKKLFDIKLAIARSLAYFLMLAFVGAIFAGLTTLLSVLITGSHMSTALVITNIILAFTLAISFQYIKAFFTKLTSSIFFKDEYKPQEVLNSLNTIITSTIELATLIKKSNALIEQTLKSQFCAFVLVDEDQKSRTFGTPKTPHEIERVSSKLVNLLKPHQPLLASSFEIKDKIRSEINELGIELIIPMYTNNSFIGFIAFGAKQTGAVYNQQDVNLLILAGDSLAVAIQNALRFEEIEQFNITLQQKVDEATHKLRRANDKLKALDETKDDFISMASHQLRTPLTSIKGYLSMVLEGDAGKVTSVQKEMLGQAFFSSQRMVYLIADLLNISRLKTGKFIIEAAKVNLADVVEQELSQLQETAATRNLTLVYEKPKHFPDLMLDETKTRQVIMNFVDNAIYYTPANGRIEVKVIDKPNTAELRVVDDGIGVAKSEQPHLFTKFYRGGNARKARPDGTGLGLFMAKKVISAQGGSIIFESEENKGSTFGFEVNKADHKVPASAEPSK